MIGEQGKPTTWSPADERRGPRGGGRMRLAPGELAALSALSAVICTFAAAVGLVAFFTKSVAATLLGSGIALAVLVLGTVGVMRGWPRLSHKLNVPVYLLAIGVAAVIAASFGGYSLRGSSAPLTLPTTNPAVGPGPGNTSIPLPTGTASALPATPATTPTQPAVTPTRSTAPAPRPSTPAATTATAPGPATTTVPPPSPTTSPVTTPPAPTTPAPPPAPAVYHAGTLTLPADYNASLDAPLSSNWDIAQNEDWPPGDIKYDASIDTIDMAYAPGTTAALGTRFAWDFRTCLNASYGGSANAPQYANISPGHGLCFKTPDDRLALLKVVSKTASQVVLSVEVWQPVGT